MTNRLITETSPYLLQHAHNPVNWLPWSDEALDLAKKENKLMIISIGYSACHWCHVMEKESFEDNEVAELMNDNFISVKIDREERPDLDSIFMDVAVMINGNGGWPLNIITLPDTKPVYALTYLPKSRWMMLLNNLKDIWEANPAKLHDQAESIMNGLANSDNYLMNISDNKIEFDYQDFSYLSNFDMINGGLKGAPKFPMPVVFDYLLSIYKTNKDKRIKDVLEVTLKNMALGGIYDTLAGGFARYSVDDRWFAPHFEKMLYDNGQLLSLYSKAYSEFDNELYKEIAIQTAEFHINKMMNNENMFYSAIDADSEGVEGKFYVWTYKEIQEILGEDANIFIEYFNIKPNGNWENAENILFAKKTLEEFANEKKLDYTELKNIIESSKVTLLLERKKRVYPQIDDKIIVSWNCLFSIGLLDLYKATNEIKYLDIAEKNINSILLKSTKGNLVYRNYKNGTYKTNAFLDDYAFLIKSLINLYLATQKIEYIEKAYSLTKYTLSHFFGENTLLLKYSNSLNEKLLKDKYETWDNVLPSSNSVIAESLLLLGTIYSDNNLLVYYSKMMASISVVAKRNPLNYAKWFSNYVLENNLIEITITGKQAKEYKSILNDEIKKHILIFVSETENELPIFKDRFIKSKTMIYICKNKTCFEPIADIEKAIEKINEL